MPQLGDTTAYPVTTPVASDLFSFTRSGTVYNSLFSNIGGQVFNVKSYGAKGDGTTDDTASIQAAINTAFAANGGVVWFPRSPTSYVISAPLIIKSNVSMYGDSKGATIFLKAGSNCSSITNNNVTPTRNVTISDLVVDGNRANQTANSSLGACAIYFGTVSDDILENIVVERCTVQETYKHGIFITGDVTYGGAKVIRDCEVINHGSVSTVGFGIYVDFAPGTVIEHNRISAPNGSVNDAIEIGHHGAIAVNNDVVNGQLQFPFGDNSIIMGNIVRSNTIQNDANTANNVVIIGNQVLSATPASGFAGISCRGAAPIIQGNYVKVSTQSGIRILNGDGGTISGNMVDGIDPTFAGNGIYSNTSSRVKVYGNDISNFARAIEITHDDNMVGYNVVNNCTTGIDLSDSSSSGHVIVNCQLLLNNLRGATTALNAHNQSGYTLVNSDINGLRLTDRASSKVGFYGVSPVVQPATTGTTSGFTAGAGSAVDSAGTFTGNTGSKAYTVGDIVLALKNIGILAA